jgi:hypothetical protein
MAPLNIPIKNPAIIVMMGISALRKAWIKMTVFSASPFARAVRIQSMFKASIMDERVKRIIPAIPTNTIVIRGKAIYRNLSKYHAKVPSGGGIMDAMPNMGKISHGARITSNIIKIKPNRKLGILKPMTDVTKAILSNAFPLFTAQ